MTRLISIIMMLFPIISLANNQTFYYEPNVVELTGIIKILKFPGPPNYTSTKDGDVEETGGYLQLDKPIDVEINPTLKKNNDNQPEKNVSLLQLVVTDKDQWNKIKEGNKVRITGTLFHAHTGHHHARVLINLKEIGVFANQTEHDHKLQLTPEDQPFLNHP
ncbi:DUF4431 domain-containing protein [Legionella sp. WA2022007384]